MPTLKWCFPINVSLGWEQHHLIEMQNYLFDLITKAGQEHGLKQRVARAKKLAAAGKALPCFCRELGRKFKVRMFRELWGAVVVQDSPYDPGNTTIRMDGGKNFYASGGDISGTIMRYSGNAFQARWARLAAVHSVRAANAAARYAKPAGQIRQIIKKPMVSVPSINPVA